MKINSNKLRVKKPLTTNFPIMRLTKKQAEILAENRKNYGQVHAPSEKKYKKMSSLAGTLAKYLTKEQIADMRENIRDKVDRF